jgi:hypothetical protein
MGEETSRTLTVQEVAADPGFWLISAYRLEEAARFLWDAGNEFMRNPRPGPNTIAMNHWRSSDADIPDRGGPTSDVAFMLLGFALENLAKGIVVCREPELVTKMGLEKWPGQSHDLVVLFDRACIPVTDDERHVLAIVSQLTEWSGRYPVPMTFDKTDPLGAWPPTVYTHLRNLLGKAKSEMTRTMGEIPPLLAGHQFAEKRRR